MNETRHDLESKLDTTHHEHDEQVTQLQEEHVGMLEEKERLLTELEAVVSERDKNIVEMHQQIKDGMEEKKIHEKKGLIIVSKFHYQVRRGGKGIFCSNT